MIRKTSKQSLTTSRDPFGPEPEQMILFPEEEQEPGTNLERMKIKSLLKTFYKGANSSFTHTEAAEQAG